MKYNLPIIIRFQDYHDIEHFECVLKKIFPAVKCEEVYPADYERAVGGRWAYAGLFYIGKKPTKKEIKEMNWTINGE